MPKFFRSKSYFSFPFESLPWRLHHHHHHHHPVPGMRSFQFPWALHSSFPVQQELQRELRAGIRPVRSPLLPLPSSTPMLHLLLCYPYSLYLIVFSFNSIKMLHFVLICLVFVYVHIWNISYVVNKKKVLLFLCRNFSFLPFYVITRASLVQVNSWLILIDVSSLFQCCLPSRSLSNPR